MPRLVYLLGVGLLLVAGALALTHELLGAWPGVNERNVRRIKEGMTVPEVEAILGGPRGRGSSVGGAGRLTTWYTWPGPDGRAVVAFSWSSTSPEETVTSATFDRRAGPQPL